MIDGSRLKKITDSERQAMLDRLDASEAENPAKNKRIMPRVVFRKNDVSVRIFHPGGSVATSVVATRNLSAGGLSFLYNGFLHKGTKTEIILRRRLGGDDTISGTITHCALITRAVHLMGVRFEAKIFPKLYLDPSEWGVLDDETQVEPSQLSGTILHIDDQEMDRVLLKHFLKGTKLDVISVGTLEEAIAAIKQRPIDCALCDLNLRSDLTINAYIPKLREAGYEGPIGIVTAETSPARLREAQDAGAGAMLSKPYEANKLLSLLSTWLSAGASRDECIYSFLSDQESMRPLIAQYVEKVHALNRELRKQIEADKIEAVRQICQTLKGTGSGFGFAQLSEVARDAVTSLDGTCSVAESAMALQRLDGTCRRINVKPE